MNVLMICPELPSASNPGSMAPAARQFESLKELGVNVVVHDMRGLPVVKYLLALPRIRRLLKQVDLVHAHFGYCGWLAHLANRSLKRSKPLVISFMGDDLLGTPKNEKGDLEWFSKVMVRANRRLSKKAMRVIVKSEEMARVVAPVECEVIPNGVDLDRFGPIVKASAREQLGISQDQPVVLFPGDPANPRKGYDLAKKAVDRAEAELGGEATAQGPKKQIKLLELWGVAPEQVPVYMNAADVMVMASLIEGSPNVVKEAMACDLPIVGVPVGDVEQMLAGVQGCVVRERDPGQIGAEIARRIGGARSAGRQALVERGLDLPSVAGRVVQIYNQVVPGIQRLTLSGQTEELGQKAVIVLAVQIPATELQLRAIHPRIRQLDVATVFVGLKVDHGVHELYPAGQTLR